MAPDGRTTIAIVGGGLAGMATAAALSAAGVAVEIFESRRRLGGRAASFRDPASGELVDFCQHVSMGCCTNLTDLAQRVGIAERFEPSPTLRFIGPDGQACDFRGSRWLPAPLHLAPAFGRLRFLTARDRLGIARAMWRLMRMRSADASAATTVGEWLVAQRQTPRAVGLFWEVVLVSALGESLQRASLSAARKVFVDGFLAAREACVLLTPQAPLAELFGEALPRWLERQGVRVHASAAIQAIRPAGDGRIAIEAASAAPRVFDRVVLATAWRQAPQLLAAEWRPRLPWLSGLDQWPASPITGAHLWFDRPITDLPHAVLVGRLGQWMFNRNGSSSAESPTSEFYYQVVISASRDLAGSDRSAIVESLCDELRAIWPLARDARLLRSKIVTEVAAVFSISPDSQRWRPRQATAIENLFVAGDWTDTGWPATMEGAVRSGYMAAEEVTASLGERQRFLAPDLERSWLAKWLIR